MQVSINGLNIIIINHDIGKWTFFFAGSPAPGPVPAGYIRVYSMRFCPFAQRARLVLNAKGIK